MIWKIVLIFLNIVEGKFLHYGNPIHDFGLTIATKNPICSSDSPFILNIIKNDINKVYIKKLSGLLPELDIISKKVLEWNSIYIDKILDSRIIPEEFKKPLILELINIVQNGDNAGSSFLEWYKELIDCFLY